MENDFTLTLPEWVFLDGSSHLGDTLEGRNILQHTLSYTILEFLNVDENTIIDNHDVKMKLFNYKNIFGKIEKHLLFVHFSLVEDSELDEIIDSAIQFYKQFMDWEDKSLLIEETSKEN
jgi:hypothetical protein